MATNILKTNHFKSYVSGLKWKSSIITIIVMFIFCSGSYGQLRQIHLDNTGNHINRLDFSSPSTGYLAFTDWIGYTSDSGRTYTKKYITLSNVDFGVYSNVNTLFGFAIYGVRAVSQDTLVVYGDYGFEPSILYSTNGGNTFLLVYHDDFLTAGTNVVSDIVFPQKSPVGYAAAGNKILKTTDKGLHWTTLYLDASNIYKYLDAIDDNNLFIYAQKKIRVTFNGGSVWQNVPLPTGNINNADFISITKGWAYMTNGTDNSYYYTANTGTTWTKLNNTTVPFTGISQVKFINDSTGYTRAGGYFVYKSTDSGKIWEPLPRDNAYNGSFYGHTDIQCINNTQLWAGGGNGFLELTTNAGGTPLPKAYFKIDTAGVYNSNTVKLVNYSKQNYNSQWFRNGTLIATTYNTTYTADFFHPVDTIKLVVSNGLNTDTLIQIQSLVLKAPAPVITGFSPATGTIGTVVTITGQNFTSSSTVSFGGVAAASVTVNSLTSVTAVVAGGSSGSVSVNTQYGTSSLAGFTFYLQAPPVISSFSPLSGPAGTVVTITGTGFNPAVNGNSVYFGAGKAIVLTASATQLTVQVPASATFRPITVINTANHLSAASSKLFLVTFPGGGGNFTNTSFNDAASFFPSNMTNSWHIYTSDIDADGKPDIVITPNQGKRLVIYKNNSTGSNMSFTQDAILFTESTGRNVMAVDFADVDGDGKQDMVVTRDSTYNSLGTITVFRNTSIPGSISFASPVAFESGPAQDVLSVKDVDGDGRPELLTTYNQFVSPGTNYSFGVFRNTCTPGNVSFMPIQTFGTEGSRGITTADIDGDGYPEVISSKVQPNDSTISIFRNTSSTGSISFAPKTDYKTAFNYVSYICAGDLNNDGKTDLTVSSYFTDKISCFKNNSTVGNIALSAKIDFPFSTMTSGTKAELGDLNGDGKPDLATGKNLTIEGLNNNSTAGNISFVGPAALINTSMGGYGDVTLADYNGDGKLDIAQILWNGSAHIFKNNFAASLAYAGPDASICPGNSTQLGTSAVAGNIYSWTSSPAGFTSSASNPVVSPGVTTSYFLTVNNGSNIAHDTVVITVLPSATADAGPNRTICLSGNTVIGTPAVTGYSYSWTSSPAGFTAAVATPTVAPSVTTKYFLLATNNNGCQVTDSVVVTVNTASANAGPDKMICPGNSTTIGTPVTGDTYSWTSSPAGFSSASPAPVVSPLVTTTYYLQVTNTAGCIAKDTAIVTVQQPIADAGTDKTICNGASASVGTAAITGYTYAWTSSPAGFTSAQASPTVSPAVTTTYYLTASNGSCTAMDTVIVTVNNTLVPAVNIGVSSATICSGSQAVFTAVPVNGGTTPSYQWLVNGINTGTNSSTFATSLLTNNAQVKVQLTSSLACAAPQSATSNIITITVLPIPVANAGKDTFVCTGGSVQLNGSGGTTYLWTPSAGLNNSNIANPVASPVNITTYILTVSNGSCSAKDTIVVAVKPFVTPSVSISQLLPNTICYGDPAAFSATPVNGGVLPVYQWQVNGINIGTGVFNTNIFTAYMLANNDQVKVIMTSNASCVSQPVAISNIITANVTQLGIPQITVNNRVYNVTNPDAAATYTWQQKTNNSWINVFPPATGITYTAPAAGEYRVKGVKGPCTSYSDSAATSFTGTPNNPFGIYLYPNPAQITIRLDSLRLQQQWETLKIISVQGREVLPVKNIAGQGTVTVDVATLAKGTYFAVLSRKNGEFTSLKFVKN